MTKETEGESPQHESSQTSSEEGNSPSEEESQTTPTKGTQGGQGSEAEQEIEIAAAEGAIDFKHPLLKGKSPEEIEALVEQQERAVKSQNAELNRYHERLQAQEQASANPPVEEEEEDYDDTFLAPHLRRLEDRIGRKLDRKLDEMVKPISEQLNSGRAQSAREKLRSELRHFTKVEPYIDYLLRQQNVTPGQAPEELMRTLYYTAVGYARENGVNLDAGESVPTGGSETSSEPKSREKEEPVSIPQHRPSSSPMPREKKGDKKHRELTEDERKLAQFYDMTPEEFLEEQNKPVDEVVSPGFSRDNW